MENWIRTDDFQLVQKVDENNFNVIDPTFLPGGKIVLLHEIDINITDYQNEAKDYITSYGYENLQAIETIYGDKWKQVFAECIAEQLAAREGILTYEGSSNGAEKYLIEKISLNIKVSNEIATPQLDTYITVTNLNGDDFSIRLVQKGETYGLNRCITHDKDEPLVEFYDAEYKTKDFDPLGQFVTRYQFSTMQKFINREGNHGLNLYGGEEKWSVTKDNVMQAVNAFEKILNKTLFQEQTPPPLVLTYEYQESYGGGDGRAINRHTTKSYQGSDGIDYRLDKNLSGCPPFYEITKVDPSKGDHILPVIPVNGKNLWGDGLSWDNAEKILFKTLQATTQKDLDLKTKIERLYAEGKTNIEVIKNLLQNNHSKKEVIQLLTKYAPNLPPRTDDARKEITSIVRTVEKELKQHESNKGKQR